MAKIIQGGSATTIRIDNYVMTTESNVSNLIEADGANPFFDTDTASTTAIDGINIPLVVPRDVIIDATETKGVLITAAQDLQQCKGFHTVALTLDTETDIRAMEKISIGSEATIGAPTWDSPTRLGIARVRSAALFPAWTDTIVVEIDDDSGIETADLVGQSFYETHQLSGGAAVGFLSVSLGDGVTGGKIRAALIQTNTPNSLGLGAGADTYFTFAEREARGEVIWSRFYPFGSQINIDFGGIIARNGILLPPPAPLAPAAGYEDRLMLAFYLESGTAASVWNLDVDLTYVPQTVYETN